MNKTNKNQLKEERTILSGRFCGPPKSANGGFTAGLLAEFANVISGEARLSMPTPVDAEFHVTAKPGEDAMFTDLSGNVLARIVAVNPSEAAKFDLPVVPTLAEAREMGLAYAGFKQHPFPTCFVCGPERTHSDGMRIFVGSAPAQPGFDNLLAGVWSPDETILDEDGKVRTAAIWGALDCPGGFAAVADDPRLIVLVKIRGHVLMRPLAGKEYVVLTWRTSKNDRSFRVMTAIFEDRGANLVAIAEGLWLAPRSWSAENQKDMSA